jgi:ubiquinol-cytochrome c reductase iron-sulfur subunit
VRERGSTALGLLGGVLLALRIVWRALRGRPAPAAAEVSGVDGNGGAPVPPGAARPDPDDPRRRDVPADPRAETWVALLLFAAAACALAFILVYVVAQFDTQLLGLALGVALALLGAAAIVAGKRVVPQETSVEPRGELLREREAEDLVDIVESGGEGISRRGLLTCATCVAGGAVTAAALAPLASFGPKSGSLHASPWRRGIRLVDEESRRPFTADEIQIGSFYSALPEGADPEVLGAGVLLIRLPRRYINLPASRRTWAPQGLMAFSKICPHAACAISLYRYPTYGPTSVSEPAFTCPCHYSTFTPGDGGRVVFGPAGRELPQLPLMVDDAGDIRAAGGFDEDIGPSWWGVRRT